MIKNILNSSQKQNLKKVKHNFIFEEKENKLKIKLGECIKNLRLKNTTIYFMDV
jgi:hypothetical protein